MDQDDLDLLLKRNPKRFADVSGSREQTIRKAAAGFEATVAEQLQDVDPPNGPLAVALVRETVSDLVVKLFPPPPPEAKPEPPPAPVAPVESVAASTGKPKGRRGKQ